MRRTVSPNHQQMQEKTDLLNTVSTQLGLNVNICKITYLGNTINTNGGTEEDVKARIKKERVVYIMLRKMCRAKQIKINTKLRIFNSNVNAVLLYGSEIWRSTQKTLKIIQTFINKCLRRILHLKCTGIQHYFLEND